MGRDKWSLPFGEETLLQRTVRILSGVVSPIIVVAAPEQEVSGLGADVVLARDRFPENGPLAGIHAGLLALERSGVQAAYTTACDVPLLKPAFVSAVIDSLAQHEIAAVSEEGFVHPLAAVYRLSLAERIGTRLEEQQLRPLHLIEASDSVIMDAEQFRKVDPDLDSLRNCNTPEDYLSALDIAGLASERSEA